MHHTHSPTRISVLMLAAVFIAVSSGVARAEKMFPLEIPSKSIKEALAPARLSALAKDATDADVLLGLRYLAPTGDPVGAELAKKVVATKPQYAPIVAVLDVTVEGSDEASVKELIARDGDNALGHYLQAGLLYKAKRSDEALESFRRAAGKRELRLYQPQTAAALFKALDVLGLKGRDRLCALSWVATRSFNFGVVAIQPLAGSLLEIARHGPAERHGEISELLLVLAGHLFSSSYDNRWYAQRALESSFRLKTELAAAENSPKMNGYAAVTQALVSTMMSWHDDTVDAQEVARFVPSRIYGALYHLNSPDAQRPAGYPTANVPEADKPALDKALREHTETAEALIEAARPDADRIVGAYLKGVPAAKKPRSPWSSDDTYVERVMCESPDVFKAAAAYERAMDAINAATQRNPERQNFSQMMDIAIELGSYAYKHDNTYPADLDVLTKEKRLEPGTELKSVITGRPYVFAAAGQKYPQRRDEAASFIVLYDDHEQNDTYQCVMADGRGQHVPVAKVKEQLNARGK